MADPSGPEIKSTPTIFDWALAWTRAAGMMPMIAADSLQRLAQGGYGYVTTTVPDPRVVNRTLAELDRHLMADPVRLVVLTTQLWQQHALLWQRTIGRMVGADGASAVPDPVAVPEPVAVPDRGDRRFADEAWTADPWFDHLKQAYLLNARWWQSLPGAIPGLDDHTRHQAEFFLRLMTDALAPTNAFWTNPKALRMALETRGGSVLRGMEHFMEDLARGHGEVRPHQTDERAFELGGNIAVTPGEVIYRNELMELIQYRPSTETVHRRPLLIVPPWINKYYIMDLKPKNSFVRWVVEQGHTVFMISWVNPDARHAGKRFDDYMIEGPLAALDVIERATGERRVNAIGYCIGGTLLACTLACLAARGQERERFASATYFTCMLDYSDPGDLGVFLDEEQVGEMDRQMAKLGCLEGAYMAQVFNLLRANELIWGVHVNNYLYGREPPAFDLLYWNGDSTRIPAANQSWYVHNMYLKNLLVEPDALSLDGTPLDLRRIATPAYFISTMEDHIAPWRSTYKGPLQFSGPVRFVLGGSGHIAGAMNPPATNKYYYLTNPDPNRPADPEAWLAGATRTPGSWWTDWAGWVAHHGDGQVPARIPGDGAVPALEPAPGRYVRMRADDGAAAALPTGPGQPGQQRLGPTMGLLEQMIRQFGGAAMAGRAGREIAGTGTGTEAERRPER